MISPGVLATTAHSLHLDSDPTGPLHSLFQVIRAPEVGQPPEVATLIHEDISKDLALLKVEQPRSSDPVILYSGYPGKIVPPGTSCGYLGFPLAEVSLSPGTPPQLNWNLAERFQGAHVSRYLPRLKILWRDHPAYETDGIMYAGSSGCPGFLVNGEVFAMQSAAFDQGAGGATTRLAISVSIPASEIVSLARSHGIRL